jgi:3-carboxy-cis,cis-muconate cycloisomerase
MPQKQNPVIPSAVLALTHTVASLQSGLQISAQHQHQRDGTAWFTEWVLLPQLLLSTASALQMANRMTQEIIVMPDIMRAALEDGLGLIQAEALSFALAEEMPRPDAQAATKSLCARALAQEVPLVELAISEYPWLDAGTFGTMNQLGQAPAEARKFVARFRAR